MTGPVERPFHRTRLTIMSRWFAIVALVATLTACAGNAGSPAPTVPSTSDGCPVAGDQTVTAADNNGTVCLALGQTLTVLLGDGGWLPPTETGDALRPVDGTPPAFTGVAAGTAAITSSRPNCPSASPGQVACHSMLTFRLAVT